VRRETQTHAANQTLTVQNTGSQSGIDSSKHRQPTRHWRFKTEIQCRLTQTLEKTRHSALEQSFLLFQIINY